MEEGFNQWSLSYVPLVSHRELTHPTFLFSHSWESTVFHILKRKHWSLNYGGSGGSLNKTGDGWAKPDVKYHINVPNASGILGRDQINIVCRMYDCLLRNLKHIRLLYVVNSKKKMAIGGDQKRIFIFYSKYMGFFFLQGMI